MRIILTCYRCGGDTFKDIKLDVVNKNYILNNPRNKVICKNCKYEDFVHNLFMRLEEVN